MEQKKLADFTDEELLQEAKKIKSTKVYDAVIPPLALVCNEGVFSPAFAMR